MCKLSWTVTHFNSLGLSHISHFFHSEPVLIGTQGDSLSESENNACTHVKYMPTLTYITKITQRQRGVAV